MNIRRIMTCALVLLALIGLQVSNTSAFAATSIANWFWTSNTDVPAIASGDVDGDGVVEVVTGGYYSDGTRYVAQLGVWTASTMAFERVMTWYWTSDTYITSVAIGNVDADPAVEIVTGGYFFDGTSNNAQLAVWDGTTLALENVMPWIWGTNTEVWAVAIGDVDGDTAVEIVSGGSYLVGANGYSQLVVWNGATLAPEAVNQWDWGTQRDEITSIAIGNADADPAIEIVTGAVYTDNGISYRSLLAVWTGTLALERVTNWLWSDDTEVFSVAVGNVDNNPADVEIITGGVFVSGTIGLSQLIIWDGATLGAKRLVTWESTAGGENGLFSIAFGNIDADPNNEIVTAGSTLHATLGTMSQLRVWNGTTLTQEAGAEWSWGTSSHVYGVNVVNVGGTTAQEIITSGAFSDGTRFIAQVAVWQ